MIGLPRSPEKQKAGPSFLLSSITLLEEDKEKTTTTTFKISIKGCIERPADVTGRRGCMCGKGVGVSFGDGWTFTDHFLQIYKPPFFLFFLTVELVEFKPLFFLRLLFPRELPRLQTLPNPAINLKK